MARIPILQNPGQLNTGNQTLQTANLPAVTNAPVGQALSQVSNVASEIAQKAARANDVANLTEASLAMNKAQADFSTFQMENPDESKWLPKWQELTQEMEGKFSQLPLTPEARLSLTSRLGDWSMKGKTQVEAQAFKQKGVRMDATVDLAKRQAIQTGNLSIFQQAQADRQAAGFGLAEADALEYAQVEDAAKAKQVQDLRAQEAELIRMGNQGDMNAWIELKSNYDKQKDLGGLDDRNYELALKQADRGEIKALVKSRIYGANGIPVDLTRAQKLITDSDLPPKMKLDLEREVATARKNYANQDILNFANRMAKGEAIDGNDFYSQYMGEAELAAAREEINQATPVTDEQQATFYLEAMKAIDEFDPALARERDFSESVKLGRISQSIHKSPPWMRAMLSEAMQAKLSGAESKNIVADGEKRARAMLLEIVRSKEAEFFEGTGEKKALKKGMENKWMDFQQKVFNLEGEVNRRIQDVQDTQKINQIVQDVLGADYTAVKKRAYMPEPSSGFVPNDNEEMANPLVPRYDYRQIDLGF